MCTKKIRRIQRMFANKKTAVQIAAATGYSLYTIYKYRNYDLDEAPKAKQAAKRTLASDPYEPTVRAWLEEDKLSPMKKQTHTARRVYDRLMDEVAGFKLSYSFLFSCEG